MCCYTQVFCQLNLGAVLYLSVAFFRRSARRVGAEIVNLDGVFSGDH